MKNSCVAGGWFDPQFALFTQWALSSLTAYRIWILNETEISCPTGLDFVNA